MHRWFYDGELTILITAILSELRMASVFVFTEVYKTRVEFSTVRCLFYSLFEIYETVYCNCCLPRNYSLYYQCKLTWLNHRLSFYNCTTIDTKTEYIVLFLIINALSYQDKSFTHWIHGTESRVFTTHDEAMLNID